MKAIKIFEIDLEKYPKADLFSFVDKKITMNKGEYILINVKNKGMKAIIACPKCGAKRPLASHTITFNPEITISPSLNNNNGGCCDYHGFLINGIFSGVDG